MRCVTIERKTKETDVRAQLNLDGGETKIQTGVGFFDHMLTAFAFHSGMGLSLTCQGDLDVDAHHSVEDCGIVLGQALARALGEKSGIARFGAALVPMDEALARAVADVSGRPYLAFFARFSQEKTGDFDLCLCEEFFRALATNAGVTLHLQLLYGENSHHEAEALFKAAARALREAIAPQQGVRSTKGIL
ncbi:MAG: imidazoleglycerol-phosphate dehydratase HisB [Oscillospiraceae bacterium]|jgi:imidazoleglycerol-phosphate dehydratase|nr:imidazoleglycerol-phosphate dehydratase HisB [Oscillospiraceae bacterium]